MKAVIASTLIAAAMASPHYAAPSNVTTVTLTSSIYTTYCPEPTTFTQGTKTYTVTEPTTLTISDCPCTWTTTGVSHSAPAPTTTKHVETTPATHVPGPSANTTVVRPSVTTGTTPPIATFTGAAAKVGAGSAFVLAVAAMML